MQLFAHINDVSITPYPGKVLLDQMQFIRNTELSAMTGTEIMWKNKHRLYNK